MGRSGKKGIKGSKKLLGIKRRRVWIRNSKYDVCVRERLSGREEGGGNIESR